MHGLLVTCVSLWSSDVLQHSNLNAVFSPRALSTPGHLHNRCIFHCMSLRSFKISDGKNPKHSSQNFFSKSLWNLHSDVTALGNHVCLDYHKNMNVIVQHGFQSQWLLHSYTTTSVHQNNKVPYEYSTTWKLLWALEATLSHCLGKYPNPHQSIPQVVWLFLKDIRHPSAQDSDGIMQFSLELFPQTFLGFFNLYWNFKYESINQHAQVGTSLFK